MKPFRGASPYAAWPISAALTFLCWIATRELIIDISVKATTVVPFEQQVRGGFLHKWVIPAIDGFGILICGIGAFGLILAFEPIYRKAQQNRTLGKRFAQMTTLQVAVIFICRLLSLILGA